VDREPNSTTMNTSSVVFALRSGCRAPCAPCCGCRRSRPRRRSGVLDRPHHAGADRYAVSVFGQVLHVRRTACSRSAAARLLEQQPFNIHLVDAIVGSELVAAGRVSRIAMRSSRDAVRPRAIS